MPLTEEWLQSGHFTIKACLVKCCRDGCPSGRFSHLHIRTLEYCQSDHWVLGHLPDQGPSPPIAQFGRAAISRKSLGGSKLLPFKNAGGHCVLGDLQCCRHFLVPFPRSVPRHHPVSELYRQFLRPHGLVFCSDMHCQLWDLLYRQVCVCLLCPIKLIYLRWSPSCRNISRMINGNRMHLS